MQDCKKNKRNRLLHDIRGSSLMGAALESVAAAGAGAAAEAGAATAEAGAAAAEACAALIDLQVMGRINQRQVTSGCEMV
jgi:hypothetical protein